MGMLYNTRRWSRGGSASMQVGEGRLKSTYDNHIVNPAVLSRGVSHVSLRHLDKREGSEISSYKASVQIRLNQVVQS